MAKHAKNDKPDVDLMQALLESFGVKNEDQPVRLSDSDLIQRALIEAFGDGEEE